MLGATRLWVARLGPAGDQNVAPGRPSIVQNARVGARFGVNLPSADRPGDAEWRAWAGVQLGLSIALTGALGWGLMVFINSGADLPLDDWQRRLAWILLVGGTVAFAIRTVLLALRLMGPPPRG
jgi:hypothetical protein